MYHAREIHAKAEIARENGEFLQALNYISEATLLYQKEGDVLGLAEVQSSKFITFKLLFQETGDSNFLILAKHSALSSVEIAQQSNNASALAIPWANLGEAYAQLKDWEKARDAYMEAIKSFTKKPPPFNNRPAVLTNIKSHLYQAEFRCGNKSALKHSLEMIKELENNALEDSFTRDAWLSGAHMRHAEMIVKSDLSQAKRHMSLAKKIIDGNKRLIIRKRQWNKLMKDINL